MNMSGGWFSGHEAKRKILGFGVYTANVPTKLKIFACFRILFSKV